MELYVNDVISSVLTPTRVLKGFDKIFIKAGETVDVKFILPVSSLSLIDADGASVVEPGEFEIMVGGSLASLQKATLKVVK